MSPHGEYTMKHILLIFTLLFCALHAEVPAPLMELELTGGNAAAIKDKTGNCKVAVATPEKINWAEGPEGKTLYFNGDKTPPRPMVAVTLPKDFNLTKGFTFYTQFKTAEDYNRKTRYQLFQYGSGADTITGCSLFLYWNLITCRFGTQSKKSAATPATFPLQANTWYTCALTYDGKELIIYVNGKALTNPIPAEIPENPRNTLTIGTQGANGAGYSFKGIISKAILYPRPLTPEEISVLD